jgi:hypothetical protein
MSRHSVFIAAPGPSFHFGAARAILCAAQGKHDTIVSDAASSFDNFNVLWSRAINMSEGRVPNLRCTHFAQCHADVCPNLDWLCTILDEMDRLDADLISVAVPITDDRGVCSCGIGDRSNQWEPLRRFTVRELLAGQLFGKKETFGQTFNAADVGYPGLPLLHNNGLFVADLRKPIFHQADADGTLRAFFNFPKRVYREESGEVVVGGVSEDWWFSHRLHELGAKTFVTTAVKLYHRDRVYSNHEPWGGFENGDEHTRDKWGAT